MSLAYLVQIKSSTGRQRRLLLFLGIVLSAQLWVDKAYLSSTSFSSQYFCFRIFLVLQCCIYAGLLQVLRNFFGGEKSHKPVFSALTFLQLLALLAAIISFLPRQFALAEHEGVYRFYFHSFGLFVPTTLLLLGIYLLYRLETLYHFAQPYQRKIARLCFSSLACMAIAHNFLFAGSLLYTSLYPRFIEVTAIIQGICYPVFLLGLLRYRLGSERISIPRNTVYTSATMLLTGAIFLGVAITAALFRWLQIDFNYFENSLIIFSVCFFSLLGIGSGTMRRHIIRFVNEQFYSRKYDYQEQFFRLHKTMMSEANVDGALTELVENMKYSVTVDDAYFFILNWQDGNFYLHENKEADSLHDVVLSGDSLVVEFFRKNPQPLDFFHVDSFRTEATEKIRHDRLLKTLGVDALFPIFHDDLLVGLLASKGGRKISFDSEDLTLIAVFTSSIGDALFKNRVLKERIEQKQFESFLHVASFIIHDIKNQIATLSLLVKNAERNINNPSFQISMLMSIKSCATSLQILIDKFSMAPKSEDLILTSFPLQNLLEDVINSSSVKEIPELQLAFSAKNSVQALMDRQALFFVIKNLFQNALDAMQYKGELHINYGPLDALTRPQLKTIFGGADQFFSTFDAYILVQDNGGGMDANFVREKLFQPFATTKEKGVGIGLYQSKTLIEKMGGRLLCQSELNKGTTFIILLFSQKPEQLKAILP